MKKRTFLGKDFFHEEFEGEKETLNESSSVWVLCLP